MDRLQEKTTAPYPPVGADGGQSLSQKPNQSIAEGVTEHKPPERDLEEILRQISRVNDPAYLPTVSMNDLYEQVYPGRPPVVDGLLYAGTYLFVGAPKVGKSFLMAQLAYHVSMGLSLWGYEVRQGTVLYLALEDNHRRLQERLYRMFGVESTGNLFFAIGAKQLGGGLEEQLKGFVREHTDTRLIIIDTLQKIREAGAEKYSYANDYEVITKLKRFADISGVCLRSPAPTAYWVRQTGPFCSKRSGGQTTPPPWTFLGGISKTSASTSSGTRNGLCGSWSGGKRSCGRSRLTRCWRLLPPW